MTADEQFRADGRRRAWNRYAYECDRARVEYEKSVEFWDTAVVNPRIKSAYWDWHKPTEKELAMPRRPQ